MTKEYPHVLLMQTKGLQKSELPNNVLKKIRTFDAVKANCIKANSGRDVFELTESQLKRIEDLDKDIVDALWDYLTEKQNQEMRTQSIKEEEKPITEKKEEQQPNDVIKEEQQPIKEEKEEEKPKSKGRIGFFEF